METIKEKVKAQVEEKLLDALVGPSNIQHNRDAFRKLLRMGHLDDRLIEIEVPEKKAGQGGPMEGGNNQFPMNEIILRFDKMMTNGACTRPCARVPVCPCVPRVRSCSDSGCTHTHPSAPVAVASPWSAHTTEQPVHPMVGGLPTATRYRQADDGEA